MTEQKHTPGPWKVRRREMHPHISIEPGGDEASPITIDGHKLEDAPNAEYIVRACNAFPQLLEACREVADEIGTTADITDAQEFIDETLRVWLERLDAAIAAATEQAEAQTVPPGSANPGG